LLSARAPDVDADAGCAALLARCASDGREVSATKASEQARRGDGNLRIGVGEGGR
jgi:hypothetical protein